MQVPFVDLKVQHEAIREELEAEFQKVFEKTAFIMGPALKEFEEASLSCIKRSLVSACAR